ncbi:MAG TPA: hypothetical protein VKA54_17820, partial [Gemmatimonadaceae bacterium]|nr:hypothetical protein [Gemmatimonadaceae bacterium]
DFSTVPEEESGQSQVFLALDAASMGTAGESEVIADRIVRALHEGAVAAGERVRYPGERTLETRRTSLVDGVFVDEGMWREVLAL